MADLILLGLVVAVIVLFNKTSRQERDLYLLRRHIDNLQQSTLQKVDIIEQNTVNTSNPSYTPEFLRESRVTEFPFQPPKAKKPIKKANKISYESLLGKNLIGILASVLIFIGLIFLGVLAYDYITDGIKILLMFLISFSITGLGVYLSWNKSNKFTVALAGCGCGSVFISILLTHIYFRVINDVFAFSLIIFWMISVFYLLKRFQSTFLSVIVHIGMVVSVLFSLIAINYSLFTVLLYQLLATLTVLVGNFICYKRSYKTGLIISMVLTTIVSYNIYLLYESLLTSVPNSIIVTSPNYTEVLCVIIFIYHFLSISAMSLLLTLSTNKETQTKINFVAQIINKIVWVLSLYTMVFLPIYENLYSKALITGLSINYTNILKISTVVTLILLVIHFSVTLILKCRHGLNKPLASISFVIVSVASAIAIGNVWDHMSWQEVPMLFTGYIIIGIILLVLGRYVKDSTLIFISRGFMCLDLCLMTFEGFEIMNDLLGVPVSLLYVLVYIIYIWFDWYTGEDQKKHSSLSTVKIISFLSLELSLCSVFSNSNLEYGVVLLLLALNLLVIIINIFKFNLTNNERSLFYYILLINEYLLVASSMFIISFLGEAGEIELILLTISTGILAFSRVLTVLEGKAHVFEEVMAGIKLTSYSLVVLNSCTTLTDNPFIVSFLCMIIALCCITFGFKFAIKSVRLYGLVLIFVCVLKLVTYDVSLQSTVVRVVSLIGGGIICFIISAIYSYYDKLSKNIDQDNG